MMKSIAAFITAAATMAGSAAYATTIELDVFVTSFFNTTTNTQDARFTPSMNPVGSLSLTFDDVDALPNGDGTSSVFFNDPFNLSPTAFDLSLNVGFGDASFDQTDFLIAEALVDTTAASNLRSVDFILLTNPADVAALGPDITDITTDPFDFLRLDANDLVTGVNLEVQTVAPVPLPASLPMLAGGVVLLGYMRKKMKTA